MNNSSILPPQRQPSVPSSYDPTYFAPLYAIEDQHFWFRVRNTIIATLVRQITAEFSRGYRVLEVGCGTGNVLRVLDGVCSDGEVTGMDLFGEGLRFARRRTTVPLVQGDMHTPPFSRPFNLIGLFDVIEHLPDDHQVLRDLHGMLAPDGVLLLTVPAHPSLWSYFDHASHHCRRYECEELRTKLQQNGFAVEYISQYMASIFPLVWLGRRLASLRDRRSSDDEARTRDLAANELRIIPVVNTLLTLVLAQERRIIARRRRLPIGTSLVAVARRAR